MTLTFTPEQKQNWYRQNFGGEKLRTVLPYYEIYFLQGGRNLRKYFRAKISPLQVVSVNQLNSSKINNCL